MSSRAADELVDLVEVCPGVTLVRDTCNVYALRSGREAVLVDFGAGTALDRLPELGVDRVTDILLTHHHRDQLQGLERAARAGIRIWAPPTERELIEDVDRHWRSRPLDNDYDLRQDRFSLLHPVPVTGSVAEYRTRRYGAIVAFTLPTPGHTIGSVTFLVEHGGRRLAFCGDLVYGEGRLWSLAATQWTYTGSEGQIATSISCALLADRRPDLLLPSHGPPVRDPGRALELTRTRLAELIVLRRGEPWDFDEWFRHPWRKLSPHLLASRTSMATSYALVSDSGHALLIDWGYDLWTGSALASDRAARRPLLTSLEGLDVEVVVPTHYHDDHVAGINLLRDVSGAEAWIADRFADVLAHPRRYDLPCLWYDPVPADRVLAAGRPVCWREYELTLHPLPGHTRYQVAVEFQVDGRRVLATGDQQQGRILNYQYRNRFAIDDYIRGARLYASLSPDVILGGHCPPQEVDEEYLAQLAADGRRVAELHRALLPLEEVDAGAEGSLARIEPYRPVVAAGDSLDVEVEVPAGPAEVALVLGAGWTAEPSRVALTEAGTARFSVTPAPVPVRRARLAAEVTVGGVPYGQQAEALVDVVDPR
ncbi:MAG TPA: MBL fold metallo-hydrolase [Solirubrobacteraceae bacterium]|nr:MBL fold metallo-hydrolase [Solirubrobacteraceae bacterium]